MSINPQIRTLEKAIIDLIESKEPAAVWAFDKLCERYFDDDQMNHTNHFDIIQSIYVYKDDEPIWRKAENHKVSESSYGRYRRKYIGWFDYLRKKFLALQNTAA